MADAIVETKSIKRYFEAVKVGLLGRIFRQKPLVVKAVDNVNISVS
jgi:ABC-type oligopeptide transport system ATPase subunit